MHSRQSRSKTSKRLCFWILSIFLLITFDLPGDAADSEQTKAMETQARAAEAIEKIPASEAKLFLYALNPNDERVDSGKLPENSDEVFHYYPVLGKAEIIPLQEKTNLLAAFVKGIRENTGGGARCFIPRHGLRVVTASATNDFVICYQCLRVHAYNFSVSDSFYTSDSPGPTFDQFLKKYKLHKTK